MHFNEPVRRPCHSCARNDTAVLRRLPSPCSLPAPPLPQGSDIWKDAEKLRRFTRAEAQKMGAPPQVQPRLRRPTPCAPSPDTLKQNLTSSCAPALLFLSQRQNGREAHPGVRLVPQSPRPRSGSVSRACRVRSSVPDAVHSQVSVLPPLVCIAKQAIPGANDQEERRDARPAGTESAPPSRQTCCCCTLFFVNLV